MKHIILHMAVVLSGVAAGPIAHAEGDLGPAGDSRTESASVDYQYPETRELVQLVRDAGDLIRSKGEAAFGELRQAGSRWRHDDTYIFVLDSKGDLLVHPDPAMEGRNQMDLKDVDGRLIIRGLLRTATELPDKPEGWYHYQWPAPSGILPRWKSSYVLRVEPPSGKGLFVSAGMYNDRMERPFVVDAVRHAVGEIEKNGEAAFARLRDPAGPYRVKDAYVFVMDSEGVERVNPAFPSLEGRNVKQLMDARGDLSTKEMFDVVESRGSGWVDCMWPKPGESVPTLKSTYVSKAEFDGKWVIVGCGVYLADAPKATPSVPGMAAPELVSLVRDAAAVLERQGEEAYPEFRNKGSRWLRDSTYLFVWSMDGIRLFHAATPAGEGKDVSNLKDVMGRPVGKMFLEAAATPAGEGWIHYIYPEPGQMFPAWKSSFVKRVTFPGGEKRIVGCGIYNMEMNPVIVEDLVNRAAALVAARGESAFPQLRDKTGPFRFMDEYVFVLKPDGVELVNPAQPSLEGKNLISVPDAGGKLFVRDLIDAAMREDGAWRGYQWYKPGDNRPLPKHTYVRKVQSPDGTFIVGAGFYSEGDPDRGGTYE